MYLQLDGDGARHAQLTRALRTAILSGRVNAGDRLPATRDLAETLGLSRNTVLSAYEQLSAEGFINGRVGSGSYVAASTAQPASIGPSEPGAAPSRYAARARAGNERDLVPRQRGLRYNLQYGEPLISTVLIGAWRRELARAAAHAGMDYPPVRGLPALRESICDYLRRRRGVVAEPDDVLIVNGSQQAFSLAARVLLDEGDRVALEEPGYFGAQLAFAAHGAQLLGVATDEQGLVCDDLPDAAPKLVCVTPSHQFPGGSVLSLSRRQVLLDYAHRHGSWILEDDYDGEFRYDVRPLAALHALDTQRRVIYVGTFSKVLFPSLRLGYLVLPPALRRDFINAKWLSDFSTATLDQAALANFMANGGFERHLRRTAKALKGRRQALLDGLRRHAADHLDVVDARAGMHVVAWLRHHDAAQCSALVERARGRGLGVYPIAPHYLTPPERQGLLLGYAGLSITDIDAATRLLGDCLAHP